MVLDNAGPEKPTESGQGDEPERVEDLVKRRLEIDRQIEGLRRDVTILFTDMRGSTSLYAQKGDPAGRALVAAHNEMLVPLIERKNGQVVKKLGDGIMALYEEAKEAVESACEIQRKLHEYNGGQGAENEIHVRVGINSGRALVEKDDVFGDVVNTAARLVGECEVDHILISRDTYNRIDPYLRNLCGSQMETRLRGKSSATEVFEVGWDLSQPLIAPESREGMLILEVQRLNDSIRIALHERPEGTSPLSHYQDRKIDAEDLEDACREVIQILKRANRNRGGTPAILKDLQQIGKRLYDNLLPAEIKKELQNAHSDHLLIQMDDRMVQVPWELLYDGKEFLCNRFAIGRHVRTVQKVKGHPRVAPLKARFLIISDPQGDLQSAAGEGNMVEESFIGSMRVETARKNGRVTVRQVVDELDQADMVHFCGHADYDPESPANSGWILSDGKLTAGYIGEKMAGSAQPLPSLVFSNACQTGKTEAWTGQEEAEIYGLANAFLIAGVQHFIGTFWEIMDTPSAEFAVAFYHALTSGGTIGRALLSARKEMMRRFGPENLIWASYLLYGDPTRPFFGKPKTLSDATPAGKEAKADEGREAEKPQPEVLEVSALRQGRYVEAGRKRFPWVGAILGMAAAVILILAWQLRFAPSDYYAQGQAALAEGDYTEAGRLFRKLYDEGDVTRARESWASLGLKRKELAMETAKQRSAKIKELSDAIKNRTTPPSEQPTDDWHSQPYTVILAGVDDHDPGILQKGENEFLNYGIYDVLKGSGRLAIVEREELGAILEEQQLTALELAKQHGVRAGRILGGHILVAGVLYPNKESGGKAFVDIINTETSEKTKVTAESKDNVDDLAKSIGREILAAILAQFPFRGTITEEKDGKIRIDLGTDHGIRKGDILYVIRPGKEQFVAAGNEGSDFFVTRIRVVSAANTVSDAEVDPLADGNQAKVSLMGLRVTSPPTEASKTN